MASADFSLVRTSLATRPVLSHPMSVMTGHLFEPQGDLPG